MVVDTSALLAILFQEPPAERLATSILVGPAVMAAPNTLEAHMVLARYHGANTGRVLSNLLSEFGVTVVAFDSDHVAVASLAFERFGKGRHPAGLNFGDCIAYSVAKLSGQSLLFTGQEFSKTDIEAA